MSKLNLAVIAGGFSSEIIVSLKSVETLLKHLDSDKYNLYKVIIDQNGWNVHSDDKTYEINKTDFSALVEGYKINFDFAFITIHGTPGEDGRLQAYFDLVNIPYSTPGYLASTITSNKYVCNSFLIHNGFRCANSIIIRKGDSIDTGKIINKLSLPCFVKPADGGSSFGVSKVDKESDLVSAVSHAFDHGSEVMIESQITGVEVTCGVYTKEDEVYALPVTEIETDNDFFDYEAKYKGESREITPARIPDEVTLSIQKITIEAYKSLGLKGMSRIDFIIENDVPYLIEVNTTPGLSEQSIIPQQVRHLNYTLTDFFDWCVDASLKR